MYIDGHEHEDVVEYRHGFVERFHQYDRRFHIWDDDGNELPHPSGFPVPAAHECFRLILVTHNESVFFQNDQCKYLWDHAGNGAPRPKGEGQSLMVSNFLTADWGRLHDDSRCVLISSLNSFRVLSFFQSEARILFKPGKNRDGWFSASHLLEQVEHAIDIFEGITRGRAQGLFVFDNAPSHQKRADDALSARRMVKGVSPTFYSAAKFSLSSAPRKGWVLHLGGARMRNSMLPTGESQPLYFADDHPSMPGWFKGMETIIREQGCGQNGGWPHNAQPSIAPLVSLIAAVGGSFSHSPISKLKNHSCRSLLRGAATHVTSIQNTTVN
jgi:hypothetical protein